MKVEITGEEEKFIKAVAVLIGRTPESLVAEMIKEGVVAMKGILSGEDPNAMIKRALESGR